MDELLAEALGYAGGDVLAERSHFARHRDQRHGVSVTSRLGGRRELSTSDRACALRSGLTTRSGQPTDPAMWRRRTRRPDDPDTGARDPSSRRARSTSGRATTVSRAMRERRDTAPRALTHSSARPRSARARSTAGARGHDTRAWRACIRRRRSQHAARIMAERDCGALPVIGDNGVLVGMVTGSRYRAAPRRRRARTRGAIVAECMTGRVVRVLRERIGRRVHAADGAAPGAPHADRRRSRTARVGIARAERSRAPCGPPCRARGALGLDRSPERDLAAAACKSAYAVRPVESTP